MGNVSRRKVVEKAVQLCTSQGEKYTVENLPGFVQRFEKGSFSILYTTPFSGAEFYPGHQCYGIDIWYNQKKVLSETFMEFEDFGPKQHIRAEWAKEYITCFSANR